MKSPELAAFDIKFEGELARTIETMTRNIGTNSGINIYDKSKYDDANFERCAREVIKMVEAHQRIRAEKFMIETVVIKRKRT